MWKRNWQDYASIVLNVEPAARFQVVAESAVRIANAEKAVVRFTFNDTDLAVTSPEVTTDSLHKTYLGKRQAAPSADGAVTWWIGVHRLYMSRHM